MRDHGNLVRQIVENCLDVKAGENVWIHSWDHTVDLASEIGFSCRQRGAHPLITLMPEDFWLRSLIEAPKSLLETLPAHQAAALEQTDAFIFMLGPRSPVRWDLIPPEKQGLANQWFLESNRYLDAWRKIAKDRAIRTLGVECCLVTNERAEALGLDFETWRKTMLAGCEANQGEIAHNAVQLASLIRRGKEVSIQTPFGTNLKFRLLGREPVIGDSVVSKEDAAKGDVKFLPSGFVEVAGGEESAEGTAVFDVPVPFRRVERIKQLSLTFRRGRIVGHQAESGGESFEDYLRSGQGDLDRFGFFGVGLNPGLKHGFTQDDKVLGGVTIGVGGNEDKGGRNVTTSNVHWWASMSRATVHVDDKPVIVNGKLVF